MKEAVGTIDHWLLICVVILVGVGLVMVFSSSSVSAMAHYKDKFFFARAQFYRTVVGVVVMLGFVFLDYRKLQRLAIPVVVLTYGMLLAVFVPGIGVYVRGAWRWISFFGLFRIAPSEVAKFVAILFMADLLSRNFRQRASFREYLLPSLVVLSGMALLIVKQPDMSSAVLLLMTGFLLIVISHEDWRHIAAIAAVGGLALLVLVLAEPYRFRRLRAWGNPYDDPYGSGYHIIQSWMALSAGGLTGVGFGKSTQKLDYLPDRHTDFIFAVIGEELGMVGAAVVLGLFLVFLWRGIRSALRAPDLFGMFLAFGITMSVVLQALINIGVVIGSLPTTGVSLPFISYGGSSLIVSFLAVGVLLNVSKAGDTRRFGPMGARRKERVV